MTVKYIKLSSNIVSLLLLSVITFLFLHSELGLFDCHHHNHSTHDFCRIVQNTVDDEYVNTNKSIRINFALPILKINIFQQFSLFSNLFVNFSEYSNIPLK